MPTIHKMFNLEVTVSQFLRQCSAVELQELELLLDSERQRRQAGNQRREALDKFINRMADRKNNDDNEA